MNDYIDREEALLEIEEWADTFCECDYVWPHVIKSIKELPAADVRPVVTCADCEYNNACLTQAFVEDASKVPFDRNTFFCSDGKRVDDA